MTDSLHFFSGGGEAGALIRAHDWSSTPLGAPSAWPHGLRTAVSLMLAARQPVYVAWGPQLTSLYNDGYIPICGNKHPQAMGQPFAQLWREVWDSFQPIVESTMRGESHWFEDLPIELAGRGREVSWFSFSYTPLRNDHGQVAGFFCAATETTQAVLARQDAALQTERLEKRIAEISSDRNRSWLLSPDLLCILDDEACFELSNPAWKGSLGWTESELTGTSVFDLLHPEDVAPSGAAFSRTMLKATPIVRFENRLRGKDRAFRCFSWMVVPEAGKAYCIGRDITEQRQAQAQLQATQEALRQSQKMEAVGQLTAGVAHDFNNLLQVISANLHLVSRQVGGNDKVTDRLNAALAAVRSGSKLTGQLLAFGRRQALEPRVVSLSRFLARMEDMLRRTLGEAVEIKFTASSVLWNISVDPMQMENALLNLAINARDAMGGTGRLLIEAANGYVDPAYAARHADMAAGHYVLISVSDTGSGMSDEVAAKAFDPFFSTKPTGTGTGLGLSMVYGFVKQSGGHVKVISELGFGTTVKLFLPRVQQADDAEDLDEVTPALSAASGGDELILVVEDDYAVRQSTVEMLTELGYRVVHAGDASTGWQMIEGGLVCDLVFTDVVMPGSLSSIELAERVRVHRPHTAVLFTSGYPQHAIVRGDRLHGDMELLAKPYTPTALAQKVRESLGSRLPERAAAGVKPKRAAARTAAADTPARNASSAQPPCVVLLVDTSDEVRRGTAELLSELGHTVMEASGTEAAMDVLGKTTVHVLLTDLQLQGVRSDVLAAQACALQPGLHLVFASADDDAPAGHIAALKPIVLKKPLDSLGLAKALADARACAFACAPDMVIAAHG
jgi:PAS domain S-box-containing protein